MSKGALGGLGFAFRGGWALGLGAVDAGLLGAGEVLGYVDTGFRWVAESGLVRFLDIM